MRNKWQEEQFVEISVSELFTWWDWLDSLKDEPEKAFDLFTKFLEACEDQLELSPRFIEELEKTKDEDFVSIDNIDDLFDDEDMDDDFNFANDRKEDIPFNPSHVF